MAGTLRGAQMLHDHPRHCHLLLASTGGAKTGDEKQAGELSWSGCENFVQRISGNTKKAAS
jgi:hypothetical protein